MESHKNSWFQSPPTRYDTYIICRFPIHGATPTSQIDHDFGLAQGPTERRDQTSVTFKHSGHVKKNVTGWETPLENGAVHGKIY